MRHPVTIVLLLSSLVSAAACKKELSRDEAKRLILTESHYPQALSDAVFNGRKWGCSPDESRIAKQELVKAGILVVSATGRQDGPAIGNDCAGGITREFQVSLTPAGGALRTGPTEEGPALRECELDFGEVTEVQTEDGNAVATFKTRYVRPTAFAKFGRDQERCASGEAINHSALFARFDDGWRVSSLQ
jgi:hypothetical protein